MTVSDVRYEILGELRAFRAGGERDLGPADLAGPLFEAEAARLAEARAHACEAWAEAELELGRHALLAPELTRTWTSWYDIITMSSSF